MNTRKLTLTALLTAIALCIFTAEAQLPSLTAIPGIKLGLANVVTVFAMYALGPGATLCIVLVRVTLGCIATGQMMAFLFSMTGGLLAFCVSALLRRCAFKRLAAKHDRTGGRRMYLGAVKGRKEFRHIAVDEPAGGHRIHLKTEATLSARCDGNERNGLAVAYNAVAQ